MQFLFIAINIALAVWHAQLIKQNRPIYHGWWSLGYGVAAGIVSLIAKDWILFILLLLERKLVFDIALNVFRGKPFFYVSATTTSILDKWQRKLFGLNGLLPAVILAGLIVGLNILKVLV